MHSILYALSQFDAKAIVVGPPDMSLLPEFKAEIDALNVDYEEAGDVRDVIGEADVIYMEPVVQADYTASREERGDKVGLTPPEYCVTRELLRDKAKRSSIILHSLPRMDELLEDVDATRHQRYWAEAFNGVALKMGAARAHPRRGGVGARHADGPSRPRPDQPPGVDEGGDRHRPRRRPPAEAGAGPRDPAPAPAGPRPGDALLLLLDPHPGLVRGRHGAAGRPRPVHREPHDPDLPRRHARRRSGRSWAATTTGSRSATSTGASATATSGRSPRPAGCRSSTCSATSSTPTSRSPT